MQALEEGPEGARGDEFLVEFFIGIFPKQDDALNHEEEGAQTEGRGADQDAEDCRPYFADIPVLHAERSEKQCEQTEHTAALPFGAGVEGVVCGSFLIRAWRHVIGLGRVALGVALLGVALGVTLLGISLLGVALLGLLIALLGLLITLLGLLIPILGLEVRLRGLIPLLRALLGLLRALLRLLKSLLGRLGHLGLGTTVAAELHGGVSRVIFLGWFGREVQTLARCKMLCLRHM